MKHLKRLDALWAVVLQKDLPVDKQKRRALFPHPSVSARDHVVPHGCGGWSSHFTREQFIKAAHAARHNEQQIEGMLESPIEAARWARAEARLTYFLGNGGRLSLPVCEGVAKGTDTPRNHERDVVSWPRASALAAMPADPCQAKTFRLTACQVLYRDEARNMRLPGHRADNQLRGV
jgi:hypothetical protein